MLRALIIALGSLALMSCDNAPAPPRSRETPPRSQVAKNFDACLAKRRLNVERYLVFATAEISFALCRDKIDGRGAFLTAALADYIVDEVPGSACAAARHTLIEPIRERTMEAFKKDGPDAFCAWVHRMLDEKSTQLWTRFWQ